MGMESGVGSPQRGYGRGERAPTKCVCPQCGFEAEKRRGLPCRSLTCPNCGIPLVGA